MDATPTLSISLSQCLSTDFFLLSFIGNTMYMYSSIHCFCSWHCFFKMCKPRNSGIQLAYGDMDLLSMGHIRVLNIGDGDSFRGVSLK